MTRRNDEFGSTRPVTGDPPAGAFATPRPEITPELLAVARDSRPRSAVVGYDGSDHARLALRYAAERIGPGGRLVAVYAFEPPAEWKETTYYDQALVAGREHGFRLLHHLPQDGLESLDVHVEVVNAPPVRALVEVAQNRGADEIVVGSRGLGRFRAVLGSTSHALLHEADRPVVIVPRRASEVVTEGADV